MLVTYKAPYSPSDVIEFYTRPVRMRYSGEDIITEPLTELEEVEIPEIGILEGFNTDGLRTLLTSFPNILKLVVPTPSETFNK